MKSIWLVFMVAFLAISCSSSNKITRVRQDTTDAWTRLMDGNSRYAQDHPKHPDQSIKRIKDLNNGQHPFAVIVACSDSRVPPELIFDQGLGDLFVIRTAGNVIGDYELGSIEYAVEHLGAKTVVVLGHDHCGAVAAYIEHKHKTLNNHIQAIIDYLKAEPEEQAVDEKSPDFLSACVKANVLHGMHLLGEAEPILKEKVEHKEISVIGAIYHLQNGIVEKIISEK